MVIRGKDLASGVLSRVGKSLRGVASIGRAIGGFLQSVPGLSILGSGLTGIVERVRDLALGASEAGSAWKDLSAQTGIGTRALQEVGWAAEQAGVSSEEYRASLLMLTKTLGKGVRQRQIFGTIGKDARGFAKSLGGAKTAGAKFEVVLAQMASIKDPMKRAAFATLFFGRAGTKLAGAGSEGAEAIKAMRIEAQRLGLVMGDDEIDRADEFGDKWSALGKVFEATKRDFGSGVIEGILPGLDDLLGLVKDNRQAVKAFAADLGKKVGTGIVDAVKAITVGIKWLGDNGEGVVLGIGAAFLAVSGPIGIAAAAVGALAAQIKLLEVIADPMGHLFPDGWENPFQAGSQGAAGFDIVQMVNRGQAPLLADLAKLGVADAQKALDDKWSAAGDQGAAIRQATRVASENPDGSQNDWMNGMSVMPASSMQPMHSIEVNVNVKAPEGVVDGKPEVKAPTGTKTKTTVTNTGPRTTSHLKGN